MPHIRGTVPGECYAPRSAIIRIQAHPLYNMNARGTVSVFFRMVRLSEYNSDKLLYAAVLEDAGPDGPAYLDLSPSHWKRLNRPIVFTFSATCASSSLQRLMTLTSSRP